MSEKRNGQAGSGWVCHKMVVDRLEGDCAVLVSNDGSSVCWPIEKLPPAAKPGTVVRVGIWVDLEGSRDHEGRVREHLDDLFQTST
jgi:hypothetical protein